jgi:hypothetical protein
VQEKAVTLRQNPPESVIGNDETPNARALTYPYVAVEDTRRLTSNAADPAHSCTGSADFKTVWWRVTPDASGTMLFSVQGERYDVGGNSGVVLTVYDTAAVAENEVTCITRKRDTSTWQMLSTPVAVTAGKTYLIEVSATGNTANDGGYTILAAGMQ